MLSFTRRGNLQGLARIQAFCCDLPYSTEIHISRLFFSPEAKCSHPVLLGRFLKKEADDQCHSITKGSASIYVKHLSIKAFTMRMAWACPEVGCLMEVHI